MTGAIKNITPFTDTTATNYEGLGGRFVVGWGVRPGADEKMEQVADRVKQGRKKTPVLCGKLKPKKR